MQLLATKEFEYGEHEGIGIMPGEVVKINTKERLPHIGWNHHQLQSLIEVMKIVCSNATLPARSWDVTRRCNSLTMASSTDATLTSRKMTLPGS